MAGEMGRMNRLWRQSGARSTTPATTGSVAASRDESPEAQSSIEEEVHREPNLGIQAKEDPVDPLLNALDDSDPWVRLSAIEAMGARRDPRDTPRLLGALKDPSSSVRVYAIIALADRLSPDMRDSLVEATGDSDETVRSRTIDAVASFGDPRDTPLLLQALKDPSSGVRVYAIIALADRLSPDMREQLLEATGDSDETVRSRAIAAIASFGEQRDTPRLLGALKDPNSGREARSGGEKHESLAGDPEPGLTFEGRFDRLQELIGITTGSTRGRRGRRHASASPHYCWRPAGVAVEVAGRTLRGFVYVGQHLGPVDSHTWIDIEPALIDPTLPVAATGAQSPPRHVWPIAYEKLTPSERAGYLDWLAGGRTDERVESFYLELFLAGLERRTLIDAKQSTDTRAEGAAIEAEIERLIGHYPEQHGIISRAISLLELLRMPMLERQAATLAPPTCASRTWEPPLELRLGLGALAKTGQPLPTEWALSWLQCSPEAYLRTPASRCPDEFARLFRTRYVERYKQGLKLRPLKQPIVVRHYQFNAGLPRENLHRESALPDVVSADYLVNALRGLGGTCSDELAAYSRYLGRHPQARTDLRALALLPRELLDDHAFPVLADLGRLTDSLVDDRCVKVPAADLIHLLPAVDGKVPKKDAVAVARLLALLDVGMEPDVRFGGPPPAVGHAVVLFRLEPHAPDAPSSAYVAATVLLDMATAVAWADGSVSKDGERALVTQASRAPGIEKHERARLAAHLDWLLTEPSTLRGIKDRCARLSETQRNQAAGALVAIAGADGRISPKEVRVLAGIFDALRLEESSLYEQLHAIAAAPASGPVTVRSAEPVDPEYALPLSAPTRELCLDRDLIDAKLAETAGVTMLLANIFTEAAPSPSPQRLTSQGSLDPVHMRFVRALGERPQWSRDDIDAVASELNLMPDGALDAINDAAFELANAPLWHGEDPLEIDAEVLEELLK